VLLTVLFGWVIPGVGAPGVGLVLIGLALAWLAPRMPRRTPAGALEAARWRAFRRYLQHAGQPAGPADRRLPYAVAFGVDRDFLQRLELPSSASAAGSAAYLGQGTGGGPLIFFPGWYGGGGGGGSNPGPSGGGSPLPTGVASGAGPQNWSNALADLLNAASGALANGGGSGPWSGGGCGGGFG
jgi:hypothetical protein